MKFTKSVLIAGLSGSAGDLTAANWKGRGYFRTRVIPTNPNTTAQQSQRNAFTRCVTCYQSLPNDIKTWLNSLGADSQLSGYNVFMSDAVPDERDNHGHNIVPQNRYCPNLESFSADTGTGASGSAELTWSQGDFAADDTFDVYYRKKEATGDEYETGWTQDDTSAGTMTDESFTVEGLDADTDYMFAMVPHYDAESGFGGGDFDNATTVA